MAWQLPRIPIGRTVTGRRLRFGRAASRRALLGAVALGIVGAGVFAATRGKKLALHTTSNAGVVPVVKRQFAQKNTAQSPYYADLQREEDRNQVKLAVATGTSYAGGMGGSAPTVVPTVQQPPKAPVHQAKMIRVSDPSTPPPAPVSRYDPRRFAAYQGAIAGMEGQFAGITPQTIMLEQPRKRAAGQGDGLRTMPVGDPVPVAGSAAAAKDPPVAATRPREKVLVAAGHGIYARTINAVTSDDTAAPVVLEAESGPLAGDRMIGSFSQIGNTRNRLVVHVNQVTLSNGDQRSVDALVVAPGSMATEVATSVDEHYVSRILLPAAAAFVQGLGEAIGQSGSAVVASPLGGVTEFAHVNTAQGVAAGAGSAASTVAGILASNAPTGPTVHLAADTDVGVLFLTPFKVPASEATH